MSARRRRARGGKGGAEPRLRIRQREQRVLHLTTLGRSQHEIAQEVGVSQPAVSKILKRLEVRLLDEMSVMHERFRVRHTVRLEHAYAEAMRAWEASKQDQLRRRQRKADGVGAGGTVAELVSENRHGDPRYLELARKCLDDVRHLWGVNVPERLALSTMDVTGLSDEELQARLALQDEVLATLNRPRALVAFPSHGGTPDGDPTA